MGQNEQIYIDDEPTPEDEEELVNNMNQAKIS